jgi:peroxiredoxin
LAVTMSGKLFVYALAGCAIIGAVVIRSESHTIAPAEFRPVQDRAPAPDFTLKDASGVTVHLADYKGKVVLLNFWATWCGPCKVEIPWFMEFERTYKDQGFAVLGVSMDDEGWKVVKPYIEQHKLNYRVAVGNEDVSKSYGGIDTLPTTLMIDREGRMAALHLGLDTKDEYQKEINALIR